MTSDKQKQPIVLTRDELYARVWSTPMSQLAAQYGISGNGLAKICARLILPCPPRGYWAKKAAGKPAVQFRLPEPKADTPLRVTITPAPPPATPTAAQTEIEKQLATARDAHADLVVPARLNRPHPIIAGWLAEHKRKAQEARHEHDPWRRRMMQPTPFTETDHRQHRFLDALFKALQPLGFVVKEELYQPAYLEVQKERVDFQLREKQKQVRRPLTEDEKRWSWNRDRGWIQELQPTGMLIFTIKTHLVGGIKHEWKDEPEKPLEACLPDIVGSLSLAGSILKGWSRDRGHTSLRFKIIDVSPRSITVSSENTSAPRAIGKADFAKVAAVWSDYCAGRVRPVPFAGRCWVTLIRVANRRLTAEWLCPSCAILSNCMTHNLKDQVH